MGGSLVATPAWAAAKRGQDAAATHGQVQKRFQVHQHTQDQALRPGWAGGRGKERERLRGRRQAG